MRGLGQATLAVLFGALLSWRVGAAAPESLRGARVVEGEVAAVERGLQVGREAARLALEYGARMSAKPGTSFAFGRSMKLAVGPASDPMVPARVVSLYDGWLELEIPSGTRFALFVVGPRKLEAIVAPGGKLTAIASEARTTVAAHQGGILIGAGGKWKRLAPEGVHVVDDRFPEGRRSQILGAPGAPQLSKSLLLEGSGPDSQTNVTWPAVPGARSYEVRLVADGKAPRVERSSEPRVTLGGLDAGSFELSVLALDESGLPGASSPTVALNVVGLGIPDTAGLGDDGTVRLQPDQRVSLLGAEGLEIGYLGYDDFLPAPKTLGLVARRPISAWLRHPMSGEKLRLNLAPMTVKAHITFGRHPEEWPAEGLEIDVKLVDQHGFPVSDTFEVSCRVTVNVQPVTPSWRREGDRLHGVLARPSGPGPWMVRVDVLDQNGVSIGMDLSEVGYQASAREARSATKSR